MLAAPKSGLVTLIDWLVAATEIDWGDYAVWTFENRSRLSELVAAERLVNDEVAPFMRSLYVQERSRK